MAIVLDWMDVPIPPLQDLEGGPCVEIVDNGERMVQIGGAGAAGLACKPQYKALGVPGALDACYCRESVLERLVRAAGQLAQDRLTLVVWDAWRPVAVQKAVYDEFRARLRSQFPDLLEPELDRRTRVYVGVPSQNPAQPSRHLTGGAIDLTLADETGRELRMGTGFDDFTPIASTRYYEELLEWRRLDARELECARNRRLLYHVMSDAGFTNYPGEWWHYDFGNWAWASLTGEPCRYGPAERPE